jgi:hypothetical protein
MWSRLPATRCPLPLRMPAARAADAATRYPTARAAATAAPAGARARTPALVVLCCDKLTRHVLVMFHVMVRQKFSSLNPVDQQERFVFNMVRATAAS